jgi:WhiB family redox-sensing transcriptional regulator
MDLVSRETPSLAGLLFPRRPLWQDRAACTGSNDPVFFPDGESPETAADAEELYCRKCRVRVECLGSALRNRDHGVWAGTTTDQRRMLIRARSRVKCPGCRCSKLISVDVYDLCTACGMSWRTGRKTREQHDEADGGTGVCN